MTLLGLDVSHYQGRPNLAAFKAAGGAFIFAKATQGVSYVDPEHDVTRSDALAAGLVFGSYGFANWGNPVAEANYFLAHATPRAGELVALDAEGTVPAGVDVVAWSDTWSRVVKAALGVPPLIYMNGSWLAGHNWAPVLADGDGLWLAKYDGQQVQSPSGEWPALSFKQFTATGTEPGVSGGVDVDSFFGDLTALSKYTIGAHPDMPLTQSDVDAVWNEPVSRQDANGAVIKVPVLQEVADAKSYALQALEAVQALAGAPATTISVNAASANLIAAALVANPKFQEVVASAAARVVSALDSDLAKRFGTTGA